MRQFPPLMPPGPAVAPWKRRLLLLLFTVSGACGLIYELAWMRRLALVFGSTTLAISTVLAAFMGGLALGSWLIGRRADRRPEASLRLYAILEVGIGLVALTVPLLFRGVGALYLALAPSLEGAPRTFFVVQFLLLAPVIAVPTMMMGGTLPLLARFLIHGMPELAGRIGALYAANTVGAAAGVTAATYLLLPRLGISDTELVAAGANFIVAAGSLLLLRKGPPRAEPRGSTSSPEGSNASEVLIGAMPPAEAEEDASPARTRGTRVLLAGVALSGFTTMVYEIVWARTLALVLGSSVYAFGAMLVVFLLGIGIGSALFGRLRRTRGAAGAPALFAWAQTGIAAAGLLAVLVIPHLPFLFLSLFSVARSSFQGMQIVQLGVAAVLLLPPALLFGLSFPAVIAATAGSVGRLGAGVGRVTAWNTLGTVAGAFLGGFVLIPGVGLRATLVAGAAAAAAAALLVTGTFPLRRGRLAAGVAVAVPVLALAAPSWPREVLASGVGFFAAAYESPRQWRESARTMDILYYKDGINTTLSVDRVAGHRYYRSNGKTDASTHPSDMAVQVLIGQIPMLLHPAPRDVFVLGLGTGVSAAAVARHPVRSIEIVDIESAGREAARYFETENRDVLADPRVRYLVADGRNALMARPRTYDVIISDPSDVWVAGVGSLFTREFYEIARSRLRPGGVMGQWWHTHALHPDHMKLIVATFRSVFPHASYWRPNLGDVVMVGSVDPLPWDYAQVRSRFDSVPGLADDLRSIGIWHPLAFFSAFVLEGKDLDALIAGIPGIHRDDHPVIEFYAPRYLYRDTAASNDVVVQRPQSSPFPALANFDRGRDVDAHAAYLLGFGYASLNRFEQGIAWMREAARREPDNPKYWIGLANQYRGRDRLPEAEEAYRRALAASPGDPEATLDLSSLMRARGLHADAEGILREALSAHPGDAALLAEAAALWIEGGRAADALPPLASGVARNPGDGALQRLYGRALAAAGRLAEARGHLEKAVSLAGTDAASLRAAAEALLEAGGVAQAAAAFETAAALDPGNVAGLVGLSRALARRGDGAGARRARDRARALAPHDPAVRALAAD